jgi:hypothetical protein
MKLALRMCASQDGIRTGNSRAIFRQLFARLSVQPTAFSLTSFHVELIVGKMTVEQGFLGAFRLYPFMHTVPFHHYPGVVLIHLP